MKSILITGASRGVGKAIALKIAETSKYSHDYSHIILNAHSRSSLLDETAATIAELNPDIKCLTSIGDVGDAAYINKLYSQVKSFTGDASFVQTLINNAAISYTGLLIDMSPEEWNQTISTNLSSIYNTCHAFLPDMIHHKSGQIVNISSVWGTYGASCEAAYSAAKGGVDSLTKALAKELAPSGISVNALALGIVNTEMNAHLSKEEIDDICEDIPIGRMMTPEEAAEGVMAILNAPDYLTGAVIKMDGGWI